LYERLAVSTCELDTARERIVESAGEMFAERGYDSTTVRDICQRAGVNIAAVNYYFGDKHRLYVEAVLRAHRWRMSRATLPKWSANTPPRQKLADFITTFIRRVRSEPDDVWRTRLVMREMLQPTGACAELVQESIRPQFELLLGILQELMPPRTSPQQLHLTAFSIVGQCLFYHVADPVIRNLIDADEYESYEVDRLAEHIAAFSQQALDLPASPSVKGARP
jgi:AcrR family transcriptional regulator